MLGCTEKSINRSGSSTEANRLNKTNNHNWSNWKKYYLGPHSSQSVYDTRGFWGDYDARSGSAGLYGFPLNPPYDRPIGIGISFKSHLGFSNTTSTICTTWSNQSFAGRPEEGFLNILHQNDSTINFYGNSMANMWACGDSRWAPGSSTLFNPIAGAFTYTNQQNNKRVKHSAHLRGDNTVRVASDVVLTIHDCKDSTGTTYDQKVGFEKMYLTHQVWYTWDHAAAYMDLAQAVNVLKASLPGGSRKSLYPRGTGTSLNLITQGKKLKASKVDLGKSSGYAISNNENSSTVIDQSGQVLGGGVLCVWGSNENGELGIGTQHILQYPGSYYNDKKKANGWNMFSSISTEYGDETHTMAPGLNFPEAIACSMVIDWKTQILAPDQASSDIHHGGNLAYYSLGPKDNNHVEGESKRGNASRPPQAKRFDSPLPLKRVYGLIGSTGTSGWRFNGAGGPVTEVDAGFVSGTNATRPYSPPVKTGPTHPGASNVIDVSALERQAVFCKTNGTVYAMGKGKENINFSNEEGLPKEIKFGFKIVGSDLRFGKYTYEKVCQFGVDEKAVKVSGGRAHFFVLTDKGNLYGHGHNNKYQLGLGHKDGTECYDNKLKTHVNGVNTNTGGFFPVGSTDGLVARKHSWGTPVINGNAMVRIATGVTDVEANEVGGACIIGNKLFTWGANQYGEAGPTVDGYGQFVTSKLGPGFNSTGYSYSHVASYNSYGKVIFPQNVRGGWNYSNTREATRTQEALCIKAPTEIKWFKCINHIHPTWEDDARTIPYGTSKGTSSILPVNNVLRLHRTKSHNVLFTMISPPEVRASDMSKKRLDYDGTSGQPNGSPVGKHKEILVGMGRSDPNLGNVLGIDSSTSPFKHSRLSKEYYRVDTYDGVTLHSITLELAGSDSQDWLNTYPYNSKGHTTKKASSEKHSPPKWWWFGPQILTFSDTYDIRRLNDDHDNRWKDDRS